MLLLAALLLAPAEAFADATHAVRLDAFAGPYVLDGRIARSGSAGCLLSSGLELPNGDLLVPTFEGRYRRTRQSQELAAGATLDAQMLDALLMLRWVRDLGSRWAVKPEAAIRREWTDVLESDRLGRGLFDQRTDSLGVELERRGAWTLVQNLGVSATRFVRYRADRSPLPGLALRSSDGALDFDSLDYSVSASFDAGPRTSLSLGARASGRRFSSQVLQTADGGVQGGRRDLLAAVRLGADRVVAAAGGRARLAISAGVQRLDSNQNERDAPGGPFRPQYFDYKELVGGPSVSWTAPGGSQAGLSLELAQRRYGRRPAQRADGASTGDQLRQTRRALSVDAAYPLGGGLWLRGLAARRWASSNTDYEGGYRYALREAYGFVGVTFSR